MSEPPQDDRGPAHDDGRAARVPRLRAGDMERDAVLDVLGQAHGAGRLDADEIDDRQRAALRARFVDQLPALIDDLPEGAALAARLQEQADRAAGRGTGGAVIARGHGSAPSARGPGAVVPARSGAWSDDNAIAILSGREVQVSSGTAVFRTYALMGGDDVYLTDALGPGVELTLECYALWAGSTVYVPGGVRIIDRTVNIMAGNTIARRAQGDGSNGTLILTGFSLMAGHDVKLDKRWRDQQGLTR